jgi:micrococcal nuclease
MGPLFDLGWRDRLHKVGGSGGHICPYSFHNQAAIPGGVKLALAFADDGYVVAPCHPRRRREAVDGRRLLAALDAADHIGEVATVCGTVASTNFAIRSKGQPTYLNLDRPYPNQVFTILIWGSDRPKFGTPETTLLGKRVYATGAIKEYRGKPEIVATDPRQLTTQ